MRKEWRKEWGKIGKKQANHEIHEKPQVNVI
jgi:hypothetical protein